jgi:hypothetical protein
MKSIIKWTTILLILILFIFFGSKIGLFNLNSSFVFSNQEEKDSMLITERIENLCNLATVKYNYQEILDYSNTVKLGEMQLPFGMGEKKVLITYRAHVTGGCQLIRLEQVSDEHVKVYLGEGQVLDNVLELDSINIYDIQQGIFNKFNMGEDTALINEDMKVYVEEHREEISSAAEKNAEELIKSFLQTLEYENIEFVFEPLF